MKRNKWIVIGIVLLILFMSRVALAKDFHRGGGDFDGHLTEFHAGEELISVRGHIYH